ncbi:MAG TPA: hypothetical protein VN241_01495 [Microbacterium sp.]|nr:hypothetical protein [Microbacterium sp.]
MRPLNSSLVTGSPWAAALLCLLLGLLTAGPLGSLFGSTPIAWPAGLLIGTAFWFAVLWSISTAALPVVRFDEAALTLRLRGREYSAAAVRSATRSISASGAAAYLTYRFTLDDGRRFRLIAVGRPFRGLTPEALRRLRALVSASSIAEPAGFSPEQQRASSALQVNSRAVAVGRAAILSDIDELLGDITSPAPVAGDGESAPVDHDALLDEDLEAAEAIRRAVGPLAGIRRISGIAAIAGAVVLTALVLTFALDESMDLGGWSPEHPAAGLVAAAALLLGTLGTLSWMIAADTAVRRVRRLADSRWEASDAAARSRGLPAPLLAFDATGARRTSTVLAYTSTVLAVLAAAFSIGAYIELSIRPLLTILLVVTGALVWASVACWRAARRDARTTAERIALRAGERWGVPG